MLKRILLAASVSLALVACQDESYNRSTRHLSPIPPATLALMSDKGMTRNDPILIRSYKKESELEVWKKGRDGKYALLKTYPICRWSGQLGPKVREGDRQAPEGFYTVTPAQMNPNSSYYLSFDTGYPNAFDRSHGRSGAHLMVHGSCSSRGCFAMTDEAIAEVYAIARDAFGGGQRGFQFQSYPFRMTAQNLAKHRADPHIAFWKNLKEGADHFEVTGEEPKVGVCGKRYAFNATGECGAPEPALLAAVSAKQARDEQKVAELVAGGTPAVRVVYDDGGQHQSFREVAMAGGGDTSGNFLVLDSRPRRNLGDVSRPEAIAQGPREIPLDANGRPQAEEKPATALAYAEPAKAQPEVKPAQVAAAPVAKPAAAAKPEPIQVASADGTVPVSPTDAKPFYARMLGGIGSLFTSTSAAPPPPSAQPTASDAPQPPRRPKTTQAPTKPQASKPTADRRAALPPLNGAHPTLPATRFN